MALFLKRMVLFLIIFLVLFTGTNIPVIRMAIISGELYPLDEMMKRQMQNNSLIGAALSDIIPHYKYRMTRQVRPDVLVMGTSRALYIKKEHFLPETKFYNAATAAQNFAACCDFIGSLETPPPHIVLNLDQWQFNRKYFEQPMAKIMQARPDYRNGYVYDPAGIIRRLYGLLLSGGLRPGRELTGSANIGLIAIIYGEGHRKDGFYVWGRQMASEAYRAGTGYTDVIPNIKYGIDMFAFGDGEIYGDTVKQVEEVLRLCREKDIMVTAFLPPFAPSLYRLMAESGHYDYMTKIYPALLPLFQRYGFELYDFTGSSVIDDAMSYDGYHPDDRGSHRILLSIKAQNSVLAGRIAGE